MASRAQRSKIVLATALLALVAILGGVFWLALEPNAATDARREPARPTSEVAADDGPQVREPVPEVAPAPPSDRSQSPTETPPLGDLFALLAWLEQPGRGPLGEVVADAAGFEALFASSNRERWVEGRAHVAKSGELWTAGTTFALDAGVWRLENVLPADGALPPDLTLAGGGVSRTLIFLGGLRPRGRVERFTLRDCTVFTDNQPLFDCRGELAALTFERVRLIGFDAGLDPSPLVRARGLGVQMRDCDLLGGYGRAPGSGSLFDVPSAALLARFERCRFDAVRLGLERLDAGVSLALVECPTNALIEDPTPQLATHLGVTLAGTSLVLLPPRTRPPPLVLDDLFAKWRELSK